MASRQAACEQCRKSKLACDHKRPACTRCTQNNGASSCVYRASPFKRRRAEETSSPAEQLSYRQSGASTPPSVQRRKAYPNPGYLGSSSHVAIFNHITPNRDPVSVGHATAELTSARSCSPESLDDNLLIKQGAEILKQLLDTFQLTAMRDLVSFWLARGVNLALAEPFVGRCVEAMNYLLSASSGDANWHVDYARHLTRNSDRPLEFDSASMLSDYTSQFAGLNTRWETVGIFFSAVIRATFDIPFFPPCYSTEKDQYYLRRLAMKMSDCALEICMSLDCLNDLQLVLQYENFIVHCYVDGNQSHNSWRRLGDVISSIFALGYHENIEAKLGIPYFLTELRKTMFGRIYSADKNIAIFLGRPPRMCKRFSYFQIPSGQPYLESDLSCSHQQQDGEEWWLDATFSYMAETRWSALCASLKEEILEILFDEKRKDYPQKASAINMKVEAQWQALPAQFKLESSLKECASDRSPRERDFLVSTRLNHLHVLFLLRLASLNRLAEPDEPIIDVAQQMLALVVETVLLRDFLANSGTGLIWKIAHYGLPAAGIVLLAMLSQHRTSSTIRMSRPRILQDLSVLAAEVQMGTIVRPDDPNYALLSKATRTIQNFLESVNSEDRLDSSNTGGYEQREGVQEPRIRAAGQTPEFWDFEIGFWESLAGHPSLSNIEFTL